MKRNHTKILSVTLVAALIVSLLAIPTDAKATKKLMVTSPKSVTAGKSIKIKTNVKCSFKSSNKKIATVNSKGVVKGKKAGKVTITVTAKKGKQKKTVKITVKKAKVVVTKTPSTTAPKVNATQPPQVIVTQSPTPKPSGEVSQSPDVTNTPKPTVAPPTNTTKPSTNPPEVLPTNTAKPSTNPPEILPTNTANPSTTEPSVAPPTDTVTPSTNPVATKQPIGMTAEFDGKIPMNRDYLPDESFSMANLNEMSVTVKVQYSDGTEEVLEPIVDYTFTEIVNRLITEGNKQYVEGTIKCLKYDNLFTTIRVELVDVPAEVIFPIQMYRDYTGPSINKGEIPDWNYVTNEIVYCDFSTYEIISSNDVRSIKYYESADGVDYELAYDYYFDYNGQRFHTCCISLLFIPYN